MSLKAMRFVVVCVMLSFLFFLPRPVQAVGFTCKWNGALADWSTLNWSCAGHIPGAADTAEIDNGTVTLESSITVQNLILKGGELTGGDITINGDFTWEGGAMGGTGTTTASKNFHLENDVFHELIDTRTVNNAGTLTLTNAVLRFYSGSPTFNNQANAKFIVDSSTDTTLITAMGGANGIFNNIGTFTKNSFTDSYIGLKSFNNTGTLSLVGPGLLNLDTGNSVHTGTFNVSANATLEFTHGTNDFGQDAIVTGKGAVIFNYGNANIRASYNISGLGSKTSIIGSSAVKFFPESTLTNLGEELDIEGGLLDLSSGESPLVSTFSFTQGTLTGSDTLTATDATWKSGYMSGSGTTTVTHTFAITGELGWTYMEGTRTVNNAGILSWSSPSPLSMQTGTTFNNQTGAQFNIQPLSGTLAFISQHGVFNNDGLFAKLGNGDIDFRVGSFNNTGTFTLATPGTFTLWTTIDSTNTGPFNVNSPDGILDFRTDAGATNHFNSGADITDAGSIYFSGVGNNEIHSSYNIDNLTLITAGTVKFFADATITSLGGTLTINGGVLNLSSGQTPSVNSFNLYPSSTLTGSDTFTATNMDWRGDDSAMAGLGTTTVTTTFTIKGGVHLNDWRTLNNAGTLSVNGCGYFVLAEHTIFNNPASGIINVTSNGGCNLFSGGNGTFNNAGIFNPLNEWVEVRRFTQATTGRINLPLSGTTAGTQYLQIKASDVTLNGTVAVSYANGYSPVIGDSITLLQYSSSRTGTFQQITYPSSGVVWLPVYKSNNFVLWAATRFYLPVIRK